MGDERWGVRCESPCWEEEDTYRQVDIYVR